jgi:Uma2 family endonuclease
MNRLFPISFILRKCGKEPVMSALQETGYPRPLKLTVDNFLSLHAAGAFEGLSKVELIEGELLTMSPQNRPHVYAKSVLAFRLFEALSRIGSDLLPMVEGAIALSEFDAPEPDIVLTTAPRGSGLIPLSSVQVAIEVADSSMPFDLGRKAELYARHRIPEYWVLGIPTRTVQQLWAPTDGVYAEHRELEMGQRLVSLTVPGLTVESDGLI